MRLDLIPPVRLLDLGISFRYLVFRVKSGDEQTMLVRGMNFRPYESGVEQQIINRTIDELSEYGFREGQDELASCGGGTVAINPYYETVTLFGQSPGGEAETDREEVFELFKQAFPDLQVSWYSPEHAAEMERKEQEAKARAKAAQAAAKAKKAAPEKAAGPAEAESSQGESGAESE